jgi:hypothetical protein
VLLAAALLTVTSISPAQEVVPLPPVEPARPEYPARLASHPDSPAGVWQGPVDNDPPPEFSPPIKQETPSGARAGMFQKAMFDATWLARTGEGGLGMTDLELKSVLALPCPTIDWPMLITPGFAVHYTDGPANVAMPARLYDAYIQFRWLHRFSPEWATDVSLTPSVFSDFEQSSSDGFRLTGHAAAAWTWTPATKVVFGVGYFNRLHVKVLPIGGLIWTPDEDTAFDLLFPQPKLARRIYWTGQTTKEVQDWVYLSAEFGGGTWAIAREGAEPDLLDITDYRLIVGMERKVAGGLEARVEIGYVFGRRVQYRNGDPEFEPNDTVLLRGGVKY